MACARFLHVDIDQRQRLAHLAHDRTWHVRAFGGLELARSLARAASAMSVIDWQDFVAGACVHVAGGASGVLGVFATLERAVEREPIVTGLHGLVGQPIRFGAGSVFRVGVDARRRRPWPTLSAS